MQVFFQQAWKASAAGLEGRKGHGSEVASNQAGCAEAEDPLQVRYLPSSAASFSHSLGILLLARVMFSKSVLADK